MIFKGIDYGTTNQKDYEDVDYEKRDDRPKCVHCEKHFEEDELNCYGLCEKCEKDILENTKLDEVIEYAKHCREEDLFVLMTEYIFTKEQAIEILIKEAKKCDPVMHKKNIVEFLDNDAYDYYDYLEKKGEI